MYWLTENSIQPLMFGILIVFVAGTFWYMLRKRILLAIAILVATATVAIVITEQVIVTDSEQLTADVHSVAMAVAANQKDDVLSYIHPSAESLILEINGEMQRINFRSVSVNNLQEPQIDYSVDPPTALLQFNSRVSADGTRSRFGVEGTGVVRVKLEYNKSATGKWLITGYSYDNVRANDFLGGR